MQASIETHCLTCLVVLWEANKAILRYEHYCMLSSVSGSSVATDSPPLIALLFLNPWAEHLPALTPATNLWSLLLDRVFEGRLLHP